MDGTIVIPGPHTIVLLGVQVKLFSAGFGILGLILGHGMAPSATPPLGWRRHSAVFFAGMLVSIATTVTTGQSPLIVFGWSLGIGFSGIAIFQAWAAKATKAAQAIGNSALDELSERLGNRKGDQ